MEDLIKLARKVCADLSVELNEDTSIALDMELSSMEFLNFIAGVEDTFGIKIPERLLNRVDTLGDLFKVIQRVKK